MSTRMNITAFFGAQFIWLLGQTWNIRMVGETFFEESKKKAPSTGMGKHWGGRFDTSDMDM